MELNLNRNFKIRNSIWKFEMQVCMGVTIYIMVKLLLRIFVPKNENRIICCKQL